MEDTAASAEPATANIAVMRTVVMAQATSAATPYELLTRVSGGKVASIPASTPSTASGRSTWLSCSECLVAISCPPGAEKVLTSTVLRRARERAPSSVLILVGGRLR